MINGAEPRCHAPRSRPPSGRRSDSTSAASHAPVSAAAGVGGPGVATRLDAARACRPTPSRCRRATAWGRPCSSARRARTGRSGMRSDASVGGVRGRAVHRLADVHGAGARARPRRRHGIGPDNAQSTLNVPWSYWKRSSRAHERPPAGAPRRRGRGRARARRRRRSRHAARRARSRRRVAPRPRAGRARRRRSPGALHAIVPPRASSRRDERVGEAARATFGNREAVLLAEAREQPPEEPARRRVGRRRRCAARCR